MIPLSDFFGNCGRVVICVHPYIPQRSLGVLTAVYPMHTLHEVIQPYLPDRLARHAHHTARIPFGHLTLRTPRTDLDRRCRKTGGGGKVDSLSTMRLGAAAVYRLLRDVMCAGLTSLDPNDWLADISRGVLFYPRPEMRCDQLSFCPYESSTSGHPSCEDHVQIAEPMLLKTRSSKASYRRNVLSPNQLQRTIARYERSDLLFQFNAITGLRSRVAPRRERRDRKGQGAMAAGEHAGTIDFTSFGEDPNAETSPDLLWHNGADGSGASWHRHSASGNRVVLRAASRSQTGIVRLDSYGSL